eukprot:UN24247
MTEYEKGYRQAIIDVLQFPLDENTRFKLLQKHHKMLDLEQETLEKLLSNSIITNFNEIIPIISKVKSLNETLSCKIILNQRAPWDECLNEICKKLAPTARVFKCFLLRTIKPGYKLWCEQLLEFFPRLPFDVQMNYLPKCSGLLPKLMCLSSYDANLLKISFELEPKMDTLPETEWKNLWLVKDKKIKKKFGK